MGILVLFNLNLSIVMGATVGTCGDDCNHNGYPEYCIYNEDVAVSICPPYAKCYDAGFDDEGKSLAACGGSCVSGGFSLYDFYYNNSTSSFVANISSYSMGSFDSVDIFLVGVTSCNKDNVLVTKTLRPSDLPGEVSFQLEDSELTSYLMWKIVYNVSFPISGTPYSDLDPTECFSYREFEVKDHFEIMSLNTTKLKVYIPKSYQEKTNQTRGFVPTKMTPFDDIVVELEFKADFECDSDYDLLPKSLPGSLYSNNILITPGSLIRINDSSISTQIYQWNLTGWSYDGSNEGLGKPVGWTYDKNLLDKVIASGDLEVRVNLSENDLISLDNSQINNDWANEYSNCLKVWGNKNVNQTSHGFVTMRTKSLGEGARWIIDASLINIIEGYHSISPLKEYKDYFIHYVDLASHDDSDWKEEGVGELQRHYFISDDLGDLISNISFCQGNKLYNLYSRKGVNSENAYTGLDKNYIISGSETINISTNVAVHETGHAFSGLLDERPPMLVAYANSHLLRINPFGNNLDDDFLPFGDISSIIRIPEGDYVFSSNKSIMTGRIKINGSWIEGPNQFNVWSCAHILQNIDNSFGDIKENAAICVPKIKLNVLKNDFNVNIPGRAGMENTIWETPAPSGGWKKYYEYGCFNKDHCPNAEGISCELNKENRKVCVGCVEGQKIDSMIGGVVVESSYYRSNCIPYQKKSYDLSGKLSSEIWYWESGVLKRRVNYKEDGTIKDDWYYDEEGNYLEGVKTPWWKKLF